MFPQVTGLLRLPGEVRDSGGAAVGPRDIRVGARGGVDAFRDGVETVLPQVSVPVERERRGRVTERRLDAFHVGARGNRERSGSVAQFVRYKTGNANTSRRVVEVSAPEVVDAQQTAAP